MSLGRWIGLLAFIVSVYILWEIRQVVLLIFAAVVLANALNILVKRFHQSGMKRAFAVLLAIFLLIAVFVGFFLVIVPPFASQFQELSELVPKGIQRFSSWFEILQSRISPQLMEYIPNVDQLIQQLQPLANRLLGGGFTFFSSSLGFLGQFLLVLILTLMLLADPTPYRKSFIRLFPSFYRHRVENILDQCEVALRGWLIGILFNMFVIASLSFVGLLILRVPLALAQAALAGILTFIPNIGPALSVIPPIAIALLETPWKALAVLILYVLIQQVESNLLTPYVMAQQVSLLPAVTLLAQVFFATFFGFLGLLLALPLTVVAQVWLKEVVIKDILDQWQGHKKKQTELVIVNDSPEAHESDQAAQENIAIHDKPSANDLERK
ncbi:MAG: AI-2E family transporter [Symplocastrum torsivum CPER-KK1]|uniref:AI-2E family transporter n=1 Tax=Symplocastrum torsivum CPER-KK1 TaxID=450513 RepID=A0A951PIB8_9CYAN|nr:AI-2E family transporter [Symplocastrum torsivum CPER-KK1]